MTEARTWPEYRKQELAARKAWLQARMDEHGHCRKTATAIGLQPGCLSKMAREMGLVYVKGERGFTPDPVLRQLTDRQRRDYDLLRRKARYSREQALAAVGRRDLIVEAAE